MSNTGPTNGSKPAVTREALRNATFGNKRKSRLVPFFGMEIEVRQPVLGSILDAQSKTSQKEQVVASIIENCFVPITGEPVFTEEDRESLLNTPFGPELLAISGALGDLTAVNFTPPSTGSEQTLPSAG